MRAAFAGLTKTPHGEAPEALLRIEIVDRYDPQAIESRWQKIWADERTWEVPNPGEPGFDGSRPKAYVLEMLPYPSGEPHVGHLKNYSLGDAVAHFRRRAGPRQSGRPSRKSTNLRVSRRGPP